MAELMAAAEHADDDYREAVGAAARAKADHERHFWTARVECEGKSEWARREHAESVSHDQREAMLIADAAEKAAKVHVQTVLGRLVAAQSEQKFKGAQDGGTTWENF